MKTNKLAAEAHLADTIWKLGGLLQYRISAIPLNRAALRPAKNPHTRRKKAAPVIGAASASILLRRLLHFVGLYLARLRLQPVQVIGGLLRMAGGGEDRALVVLQDFQP